MEKKQKKILLVTGIYPPDIGGPATYVSILEKELRKRFYDVCVVTYGEGVDGDNLKYVSRKQNIFKRYFKLFSLIWSLRNVDVVYAFDSTSVGLPCAIVKLFFPKFKFVIRLGGDRQWEDAMQKRNYQNTLRNYYLEKKFSLKENIFFLLNSFVLKKADKIVFNAEILKDIYVNYRNLPNDKAVIIKNFKVDNKDNYILNKENKNNRNILFCGRLVAFKNVLNLISAFENIVEKLPKDVILEIIGEGPEFENIFNYIEKSKFKNRISLAGKLKHSEALNKIYNCDIFVLVSYTEVNAHTIAEALSMDKPIILTKESESFYIGEKKENLFYIDPTNKNEIENALINFFDFKENNKLENKIINYEITWDIEKVINEHIKIFEYEKND